jgi:hypothetical protein
MLRLAFAIYMVLVMAAGPNLCCCSLTHLFAGHADEKSPRPPAPACCQSECGGEDAEHQGLDGNCPREKKDCPHKPGCSCREDARRPALVDRPVETPDQFQASSSLPVSMPPASLDALSGVNGVAALPGDPPPFLTADDLLRVHHQLRC